MRGADAPMPILASAITSRYRRYPCRVELRHLQTFIAVYERGGFRRAADSQHTAQPALTRHVQQLERELGVQLFRRSPGGATPTDAGLRLYEELAPPVRALADAIARVGDVLTSQQRLAIGHVSPAMRLGLPRVVQALASATPPVAVHLEELGSPEIVRRLREGRLDAGLIAGTVAGRELDLRPIVSLRFAVMAPRGFLRGREGRVALADLEGVTVLSPVAHEPAHGPLIDAIREHADIQVQDAFGIDTIRALVSGGVGVSLTPRMAASAPAETLELLETDPPLPEVPIGLATQRLDRSKPVTALRRLVSMHMTSADPGSAAAA